MPNFKRSFAAGAIATLAIAAVLAGCGSSSSSSVTPSKYMSSVCGVVAQFASQVTARRNALSVGASADLNQRKQVLQKFLTDLEGDADRAISQLKAAGTPKVTNGKQVSSDLVSAFTQMKQTLSRSASQAASLPTSSGQAFQAASQSLGNSIQTTFTNIASSISALRTPELDKAAASQPACKAIGA